jgi:hypothetical protein
VQPQSERMPPESLGRNRVYCVLFSHNSEFAIYASFSSQPYSFLSPTIFIFFF